MQKLIFIVPALIVDRYVFSTLHHLGEIPDMLDNMQISVVGGQPEEIKSDREIVLVAVKQNGWALRYVAEELKSDKEVALAAVKQKPNALQFVPEHLKLDRETQSVAGVEDVNTTKIPDAGLGSNPSLA